MDGAILRRQLRVATCDKNTTYHHLNNPVIHDLLEQHGKTLNFVGFIITNENVYHGRQGSAPPTGPAKLAQFLELDGGSWSPGGASVTPIPT